jgi:hypothetical protein
MIGMEAQPKRRWFRFGIRTALIAVLLISIPLASYRLGVEHGRTLGPMIPADFSADTLYAREYDIFDIVKSKSDADMLIQSLRATAEPKSWDVIGGYAEVALNSDARTLTVSQIVSGHISVMQYLRDVRDSAAGRSDLADVLEAAELTYNARRQMDDSN